MEGEGNPPPVPAEAPPATAGGERASVPPSRRAAVILVLLTVAAVVAAFVVPPHIGSPWPGTPTGVLMIRASPLFKSDAPNAGWHLDFVQAGAFDLEYRGPKAWLSIDCEVWDDGWLVREPRWWKTTYDGAFRTSFSVSLRKESAGPGTTTLALKGYLWGTTPVGRGTVPTFGVPLFDERIEKPTIGPLEGLEFLGGLNPAGIKVAQEGEHVLWSWVVTRGAVLPGDPLAVPCEATRWAIYVKLRFGLVEAEAK